MKTMKTIRRLLSITSLVYCLSLSFNFSTASAQTKSFTVPKLSAEALRKDISALRDTLVAMHPGIYRYKSKVYFNHIFDSCYSAIRDSMPVTKFYTLTSRLIGAIEDGHTNCRLPRQLQNDYLNNVKVFPAIVYFIANKTYLLCCKQNDGLAESELIAIDGQPISKIKSEMFGRIPSDGSIKSRKNWELNNDFYLLYNCLYGEKSSFKVTYKTKSGEIKTSVLQADLLKNMVCMNLRDNISQYLKLEYKPGNVAVMTIKTFFDGFLDRTKENFDKFLAESFKALKDKKIEKLIIDIRNNGGGNDGNGIKLYAYLTQKPFRYYASQETVKEKFAEANHPNLQMQNPETDNFKGKVYVLINGRSFSAAAEFPAVVRSNNRGIFIGEETGGGYYGNTSGGDKDITLPNSQITARIPLVKYTSAVKKAKYPDRGIIPDYTIYPTVTDFIQHKDVQLEYTLKLAGSK